MNPDHSITPAAGCSGFCRDCGEFHSLPAEKAMEECKILMEHFRKSGRIDFELPVELADPGLSLAGLYSEMRGKMFGILICEDENGNEVVLRAFSGKLNDRRSIPGWAPHLFDDELFNAAIEAGNMDIHPLTNLIDSLDKKTPEWKIATEERKRVSQGVLGKLYALYSVHNFKGEVRTLAEAFLIDKSIPTGTGDCCAPKLLNYAAINGLKPISIAEFFWGRETASGGRKEGHFYPACEDKCQPLLGFILCS